MKTEDEDFCIPNLNVDDGLAIYLRIVLRTVIDLSSDQTYEVFCAPPQASAS